MPDGNQQRRAAAVIRYTLRRLLIVPLMFVLTAVLVMLLPIAAACQAVTALGVVGGHRPRWRALRVLAFGAVYTAAECLCLVACLLLWLASPVPRWRDEDRWRARHVQVLDRFLATLIRTAELVFAFRLKLESPRGETITAHGPLIVLGRHAGPGASLVLVHVLLRLRERVPMIVLKAQLKLDPALDVLLTRIGCAFIGRTDTPGAGPSDAVARLASRLRPRDALVLFPEGSDWTPTRHRLAIRRLHRKGLNAQATAAASMPHVLPPRPAGTFAALRAAPTAQLAVFMHTGHDDLLDAASVWRALPLQRELHMVWWNEPRPEVATEEDCARWLNGVWRGIDDWIGEQAAMAELVAKPAAP
jgi:1-acyl-sn-glycerol-3-phosphate acyltransferase